MRQTKPIAWMKEGVKTPPFSEEARIQAGVLLRQLQEGMHILYPRSAPIPSLGVNCHELRIKDGPAGVQWRIIYHIAAEAIVILDVFEKKTMKIPRNVMEACKIRLAQYYRIINGD